MEEKEPKSSISRLYIWFAIVLLVYEEKLQGRNQPRRYVQ
jgi:hypothetical protein